MPPRKSCVRGADLAVAFAAGMVCGAPAFALDAMAMTYVCERGVEIPAVYVNHPGEPGIAVIHVEDRMINLVAETSASGARYGWPSDGSHYVWWTKGDAATLYWNDGATGEETPLLSECSTG